MKIQAFVFLVVAAALALVFGVETPRAATFNYLCTGTASDQASLQSALNNSSYSTINISSVCKGNFVASRSLTLNGPGTLDAASGGTAFLVNSGATVVANKLTLTGALQSMGAQVSPASTLQLSNSNVIGNGKGGISVNGTAASPATLTLVNSDVSLNTGPNDGGGIAGVFAVISISSSQIVKNQANEIGGGVFLDGGSLTIVGTKIDDNSTFYAGGGIANDADFVDSTVTLGQGVKVRNNTSGYGGGIYNAVFTPGLTATIAGAPFTTHSVSRNDGFYGGGIYDWAMPGGTAKISIGGLTVQLNSAQRGGGVYDDNTAGATSINLPGAVITGNTVTAAGGGGGCANAAPGPAIAGAPFIVLNTVPNRVNGC